MFDLPITSKNSCNVVCCKISGKETLDFLVVDDDLGKFALVAKLVVSLSTPKSIVSSSKIVRESHAKNKNTSIFIQLFVKDLFEFSVRIN